MEFGLSLEQRQFDDSLRDFLKDRLPMERDTLVRIASMTKAPATGPSNVAGPPSTTISSTLADVSTDSTSGDTKALA